jgi:hypothetical protein
VHKKWLGIGHVFKVVVQGSSLYFELTNIPSLERFHLYISSLWSPPSRSKTLQTLSDVFEG